jgi:hypothetical protein
MAKIKIDVYEGGTPSDQIVELAKDPRASGVLLEIEDHKDNQRVVISIVGDDAQSLHKQ